MEAVQLGRKRAAATDVKMLWTEWEGPEGQLVVGNRVALAPEVKKLTEDGKVVRMKEADLRLQSAWELGQLAKAWVEAGGSEDLCDRGWGALRLQSESSATLSEADYHAQAAADQDLVLRALTRAQAPDPADRISLEEITAILHLAWTRAVHRAMQRPATTTPISPAHLSTSSPSPTPSFLSSVALRRLGPMGASGILLEEADWILLDNSGAQVALDAVSDKSSIVLQLKGLGNLEVQLDGEPTTSFSLLDCARRAVQIFPLLHDLDSPPFLLVSFSSNKPVRVLADCNIRECPPLWIKSILVRTYEDFQCRTLFENRQFPIREAYHELAITHGSKAARSAIGDVQSNHSVEEAHLWDLLFNQKKPLLKVLGPPGVGKTTWARRLALTWTDNYQKTISNFILLPLRFIPVALESKDPEQNVSPESLLIAAVYGERISKKIQEVESGIGLPGIKDVVKLCDAFVSKMRCAVGTMSTPETDGEKTVGQVVFVLDGMDEVVAKEHVEYLERLAVSVQAYAGLITTSRPLDQDRIRALSGSTSEFSIQGFSVESQERFVHWFFGEEVAKAGRILTAIHENRALSVITRVPVLLEILCWLARRDDGEEKTLNLVQITPFYQQTISALYDRWLEGKLSAEGAAAMARVPSLRNLFEETVEMNPRVLVDEMFGMMAGHLHRNGLDVVTEELGRNCLRDVIAEGSEVTDELFDTVFREVGLLQAVTLGSHDRQWCFLHKTLMEWYLARRIYLQICRIVGTQSAASVRADVATNRVGLGGAVSTLMRRISQSSARHVVRGLGLLQARRDGPSSLYLPGTSTAWSFLIHQLMRPESPEGVRALGVGIIRRLAEILAVPTSTHEMSADDCAAWVRMLAEVPNDMLQNPDMLRQLLPEGIEHGDLLCLAESAGMQSLLRGLVGAFGSTARARNGRTVLHEAIRVHDFETARWLIEECDILDDETILGTSRYFSPVHEAAREGDVRILRMLLDAQPIASRAADEIGRTPLHWAVLGDHLEAVKLLLARDVVVDQAADDLETPLHLARRPQSGPIAHILLEHGHPHDPEKVEHRTPLSEAVICGGLETVRLLLDAGADPNHRYLDGEDLIALHDAAWHNRLEIAKLLLERGSPAKMQDFMKFGPLTAAAEKSNTFELIELLIEHGADVNEVTVGIRFRPLHHATSAEMAEFLIKHGADVTARCYRSYTPYVRAARHGHLEKVKFLHAHPGTDRNARGELGRSATMLALSFRHYETYRWLISQ